MAEHAAGFNMGIFSQMSSICVGDKFDKTEKLPERFLGKQFTSGATITGNNADAMLDKTFKRLSEGDTYLDPGALERKHRVAQRKMNISEKAFYPSQPGRKAPGPGTSYGCIGKQPDYMAETADTNEKDAAVGRNFYTNPPKKGGFGVPGTTISPANTYLPDEYLASRTIDKVERAKAREKIHKPFNSTGTSRGGYFDSKIFENAPGAFVPRDREKYKADFKAFRPSHPAKKGFNSTHFPSYVEDPLDAKIEKAKAEAAERKKLGVFKPSSGPKSYPIRVV
mmetsp:Transcript_18056/g.58963  ORF Transcript_18056/g.58963 Transcript_18056/m.58963 type:complete len:281 (+) Transcript_18056:57-899(+)